MSNPYAEYYLSQVGSALPAYAGARVQRGGGFGSVIGSLFRSATPLLKKGALAVGKSALKTGLQVASDLVSGQNIKSSLKRRATDSAKNLGRQALRQITASASAAPPAKKAKKKQKKKKTSDIFS